MTQHTTKAMSLNIFGLSSKAKATKEQKQSEDKKPVSSIRSTIFSLGSDARVSSLQVSTPDLYLVEIMKDQLKQLFVRVHWKIPRFDIDSAKVLGFNVYRKRIRTFFDTKLSPNQFAKLTANLKSNGDFSEAKSGISNVKSGMIGLGDLNPNLSEQQITNRAQLWASHTEERNEFQSQIENFIAKFEKIAFVDYSQFIKKEQLKTVFVTDATNISMFYDDKAVGFGEEFEYYVSSVSVNFDETYQSDVVKVLVRDNRGISPPDIFVKQIDVTSMLVQVSYKSEEQIDNVFIFRREVDNDVEFLPLAGFLDVQKDTIEFLDKTSFFGKQFIYRAFTENLHGVLSPATELTVTSSTGIEKSRSNTLKKPVFSAVQQKNIAKLTISPNDLKVLFFRIDRRDLSIDERAFTVPGRDTNGYGGNGWVTNQLFFDRSKQTPIFFIDNTVLSDHIYQYRIVGVDRFGNTTSCSYQTIEILNRDLLKSPINLRISVLREFPLKIMLRWDDENVYDESEFPLGPLAVSERGSAVSEVVNSAGDRGAGGTTSNIVNTSSERQSSTGARPLFEVQRRMGHNNFASFPLTENKFIVDEVSSDDVSSFSSIQSPPPPAVVLPNRARRNEDARQQQMNVAGSTTSSIIGSSATRPKKTTQRSNGVLDFLKENFFYFYRVKVLTPLGSFSLFSEEIKILTVRPLPTPTNFIAVNDNPKVKPAVVKLSWDVEDNKLESEHFVIERKVDNANDAFDTIGKSYFGNHFFDRSVPLGKDYIYRLKSIDTHGQQTIPIETRIRI